MRMWSKGMHKGYTPTAVLEALLLDISSYGIPAKSILFLNENTPIVMTSEVPLFVHVQHCTVVVFTMFKMSYNNHVSEAW